MEIQPFGNLGIQGLCISGFGDSDIWGFGDLGIQGLRDSGIPEIGDSES